MVTKLARIADRAKKYPEEKFTSLMHLVNSEFLESCHNELSGNKVSVSISPRPATGNATTTLVISSADQHSRAAIASRRQDSSRPH